ncbi:unnamed protein product [Paramecium sonneborni]|uniref:Uncharacterized protein n=1 Tax=Paramecium sonneborni TaxID=65129 RepID=A0A8S1L7T7_9CILI|nr:unnamed protein product [Paramecium sonneborni]
MMKNNKCEGKSNQQKCKIWDFLMDIFIEVDFQICFTETNEIKYIKDGSILRIDQIQDSSQILDILHNLEQIQYLQKKGKFSNDLRKTWKWITIWNGEILINVGGMYSEEGKKQGQWKELFHNYWRLAVIIYYYNSKAQVYEEGEYMQGQKIGIWKYLYRDCEIGGGSYNYQGNKIGRWIELSNNTIKSLKLVNMIIMVKKQIDGIFIMKRMVKTQRQVVDYLIQMKKMELMLNLETGLNQVIHFGMIASQFIREYIINRIKKSEDGIYIMKFVGQIEQIGGGSFIVNEDNQNSVKIGDWIELSSNFGNDSLVTYYGQYNQQGQKVGRWNIYYEQNRYQELIGGGSYGIHEKDGSCVKVGKWIQQGEGFQHKNQVTFIGEYNKYGQKIGQWDINWNWNDNNKKIGGGLFSFLNGVLKSFKIGKWIELGEGYHLYSQVTMVGEYNSQGQKFGKWDTYYTESQKKQEQIGGGFFYFQEESGMSVKIGNWIEVCDLFAYSRQITFQGEYNKNGQKFGRWDIYYQQKQIGGGQYEINQGVSNSIKIGRWIEISDDFYFDCQVTYAGEYSNDGQKIGRWDSYLYQDDQNDKIGGGIYDLQVETGTNFKIGKWVELSICFKNSRQITFHGEYNKNGQKFGRWDSYYNQEQIGGGSYKEKRSVKIGRWIELSDNFGDGFEQFQVTHNGEYNENGRKVGIWEIQHRQSGNILFDKMQIYNQIVKIISGGGDYIDGLKNGKWKELSNYGKDITYNGEYKNGLKVGRWDINCNWDEENSLIGGGFYNINEEASTKIGEWIELSERYKDYLQITYTGEYKNGQKIGKWDTYYKLNNKNEKMGGGCYEIIEGILNKNGNWIELSDNFMNESRVTYIGEYRNGKKVDRWDIWWQKDYGDKKNENIGGGSYQAGIKIGKWVELSDNFGIFYGKITYNGQYLYNKKVGTWVEIDIRNNEKLSEKNYDV